MRPTIATLLALSATTFLTAPTLTAQTLPSVWQRSVDFVPAQNPHPDASGNAGVWSYSFCRGFRCDAQWSPAWGSWQSRDSAPYTGGGLIHATTLTQWTRYDIWKCWWCMVPKAVFENVFTVPFTVDVRGPARIAWTAFNPQNLAYDSDVTLRIFHRAYTGAATDLLLQTFAKPSGGTAPESIPITLDIRDVVMNPGDRIYFEIHALAGSGSRETWVQFLDRDVQLVRHLAARETVRRASPPNPLTLNPGVTSAPLLGATWDPIIQQTSPNSLLDVLAIGLGGPVSQPLPFGTLLCTPEFVYGTAPGTPFAVPIPPTTNFLGVAGQAQASAWNSDGTVQLTNAVDFVVGNR